LVSIHNGGRLWAAVDLVVLDGTKEASNASMLFWDVNNGISRRSWARNEGAIFAIKASWKTDTLSYALPNSVADDY
jgi:urocanate hydratase